MTFPRIDRAAESLVRRRSLGRFMCCDADLPSDLAERIWRDPHALIDDADKMQDKPRCTVARIDHPIGQFVWKHHNWGNIRRTIRRSLSRSVGRKTWTDGQFLVAAGIPTPRPRAFVERRFGQFGICSYLLTDYIAGTSLYRLMRFERPSEDFVRQLARQVAQIWQQLDDLRVWHNDFKTENLLVDPVGKVWLIDLERMRHVRDINQLRRRQFRDIGDLLHPRNWRSEPAAAEIFRQEILQTPAAIEALSGPSGCNHPLDRPLHSANRPSQLVTVLIPCRNAAQTITACVDSVRDTADEILIADAGSTDDTVQVARQLAGCRVIGRRFTDDVAFEAWAHEQACHPWILRILPTERLNAELGRQVQDVVATEPKEDGFRISRDFSFRGQRLKYGGLADRAPVRLYRKQIAHYQWRDGRVEVAIPTRTIGSVQARLACDICLEMDDHLHEMTHRAAMAAGDAKRQGRRALLWRAPWQFLRSYVLGWGWVDGWPGLHASCLSALAVYLIETKLWELEHPAAPRRELVRDSWRPLRLFDPGAATATVSSATAEEEIAVDMNRQQLRPAA